MVAIAIFGLIITIVYTSFNTITSGSHTLKSQSTSMENARWAMMLIEKDLRSIFVSVEPEYKKPEFTDSKDLYRIISERSYINGKEFSKLRFATFNHLSLNNNKTKTVAYVQYYVVNDPKKGFLLKRSDSLDQNEDDFSEDLKVPSLGEGVVSFKLTFFNSDNIEFNEWNSDSNENSFSTPKKIYIELILEDQGVKSTVATSIHLRNIRELK
jgi:type II secretory pathway component PulJ